MHYNGSTGQVPLAPASLSPTPPGPAFPRPDVQSWKHLLVNAFRAKMCNIFNAIFRTRRVEEKGPPLDMSCQFRVRHFSSAGILKVRVGAEHMGKAFLCDEEWCDREYRWRSELSRHKRSITKTRKLQVPPRVCFSFLNFDGGFNK